MYVAMYHYVRDLEQSRYPNIKGLDYRLFKKQISLMKDKFNIITMEQMIDAWSSQSQILPSNALLLTFDDGYIDHYLAVLPILKENNLQGSFFIPGKTFSENSLLDVNKIHFILASKDVNILFAELLELLDYFRGNEFDIPLSKELLEKYGVANRFDNKETVFIKRMLQTVLPERLRNIITSKLFKKFIGMPEDKFARELYMNRDQIRFMKDSGMFIGVHGYDHYWLGNLAKEKMENDVSKALDVMDEFIDRKAWVMNYPYGSYNDAVIDFIKSENCKIGLTTEVRNTNVETDSLYKIPRLDTNDFPPISENYKKY